jgi:uncharacterized protein (TIGR03435 family)
MRAGVAFGVMWLAAGLVAVLAQEPSFEVAAIKINTSGSPVSRITAPAGTGRFDAVNAPVRLLILNAYGIPDFQLTGGPSWIDSLRVDIQARAAAAATRDDISRMLRALLAERFHLEAHREPREMPVYALVLARSDGRLGPRMRQSTTDCTAASVPGASTPQTASGQLLCGTRISPVSINAGAVSMARLAATLSGTLSRRVTDETGLAGVYDLQLTFRADQAPAGVAVAVPADPDAPSIFAALQEQLGLKLEPRRGAVEVFVIDRIERPDQN